MKDVKEGLDKRTYISMFMNFSVVKMSVLKLSFRVDAVLMRIPRGDLVERDREVGSDSDRNAGSPEQPGQFRRTGDGTYSTKH